MNISKIFFEKAVGLAGFPRVQDAFINHERFSEILEAGFGVNNKKQSHARFPSVCQDANLPEVRHLLKKLPASSLVARTLSLTGGKARFVDKMTKPK